VTQKFEFKTVMAAVVFWSMIVPTNKRTHSGTMVMTCWSKGSALLLRQWAFYQY